LPIPAAINPFFDLLHTRSLQHVNLLIEILFFEVKDTNEKGPEGPLLSRYG
jgi:hypothetical protein